MRDFGGRFLHAPTAGAAPQGRKGAGWWLAMLALRCAPRARLVVVPRRCSHRRTVEEKIEDLGGTVIDTSNQKSLVKAYQSRVRLLHTSSYPPKALTFLERPIEKPHKSELSMKRRRQEMNTSLLQAKTLDELGYVRVRVM